MNAGTIKGHDKQLKYLNFLLHKDMVPSAVFFTGQSGIGKRLVAERFINSIFCTGDAKPCLECNACKQFQNRIFSDIFILQPNQKGAIPIGSEDQKEEGSIRWLIEKLSLKSFHNRTGVIIDGVDRISEEGQNALLKTIEEPSKNTVFVLISSNRSSVLPTIISRCIELKFYPLTESDVRDLIKDTIDKEHLDLVAELSGGSLETAAVLSNTDLMHDIFDLCIKISSYMNRGDIFEADFVQILKAIDNDLLLDIIINIYRKNLLLLIYGKSNLNDIYSKFFISDIEKITRLIKILIALKKLLSSNINIKNALKGMLYSDKKLFDDYFLFN